VDEDDDTEWNQLRKMEEFLKMQRLELLQQGAPDSDNDDNPPWPDEREDCPDEEEDDSLEDADLAFITAVLESFSKPNAKASRTVEPLYANFTPEGAPTQTKAKRVTPTKFNQNSTSKTSVAEKFSCFPTLNEEGTDELTDTEEETEFENQSQGICSITKEKRNTFATWQLFIPQEPVSQNSLAQPWWSVSSPQEYSSLEPTLTKISSVSCPTLKIAIQQMSLKTSPEQHNHRTKQIPPPMQKLYKPTTKHYRHNWSMRWPELNRTSRKNKDLGEQISRSPLATRTIQALEAAIAIFEQNKPAPEFELSEYATGNRHWKCSPAQHPVPNQELLLYDVQKKHWPE